MCNTHFPPKMFEITPPNKKHGVSGPRQSRPAKGGENTTLPSATYDRQARLCSAEDPVQSETRLVLGENARLSQASLSDTHLADVDFAKDYGQKATGRCSFQP
jgi:hypothetical protein